MSLLHFHFHSLNTVGHFGTRKQDAHFSTNGHHLPEYSTHKEVLDRLSVTLQIANHEGWYEISSKDILQADKHAHHIISSYYNKSLINALDKIYPRTEWQPWRFEHYTLPSEYWNSKENQRKYFAWVWKQLGIHRYEDWYEINPSLLKQQPGGKSLMKYHNNSMYRALHEVYPDVLWEPWRFANDPHFWENLDNQRQFFEWLAKKLDIDINNDWEKISKDNVIANGGISLWRKYGKSHYNALKALYPHVQGQAWKLPKTPESFWKEQHNQRNYFDWLGNKLGVNTAQDWYNVTVEDVINHYGSPLMTIYNNILGKALVNAYPDEAWMLQFHSAPRSFWADRNTHHQYFDFLAGVLELKDFQDWYHVTTEEVAKYGGATLLNDFYSGTLCLALQEIYPDIEWQPWKFYHVPRGYWDDIRHQKKYLDWVFEQLGIDKHRRYNDLTEDDVLRFGGKPLLAKYQDSLKLAISRVYPFIESENYRWDDIETQRQFFKWLGLHLDINKYDQWYRITKHQLVSEGGEQILDVYGGSLKETMAAVYPEYEWRENRFQVSKGFWKNAGNHRKYFDWLGTVLGVRVLDDWYNVHVEDIKARGGSRVLAYYRDSLSEALETIYPENQWQPWRFARTPKKYWENKPQ